MEDSGDEGVLTHFPNIQSPADGTIDVSVYILCLDNLRILKVFERRFKGFEQMKFTVSLITNLFQERDIIESGELISSVLRKK
jgi:hypothetical protein